MSDQALSTLPRQAKGRLAPLPALEGPLREITSVITAWPEVEATTHWALGDASRVDGVDFYVGEDELGHIHLDGSIHLASSPSLGAELVDEGLGRPFAWAWGWTVAKVDDLGVADTVRLFRRNYDRLRPTTS